MPRSNDEFINGTYLQKDNGDFSIFHGTGQNSVGTQSGAHIAVSGPQGSFKDYDDLAWNARARGNEPEDDEYAFPTVRDSEGNRQYEYNKDGDRSVMRQGVLFEDRRTKPKVNLMVATKDAAHHTASLLEAANKKSMELYNQPITHSDNLSAHSLPIVNRLIRAGLSEGPEIQGTSNSYDWKSAHNSIQDTADSANRWGAEEMDTNEFKQGGREFIKRLTSAEKTRGLRPSAVSRATSAISGAADKATSRLGNFRQDYLPGMNLSPSQLQNKARAEDD